MAGFFFRACSKKKIVFWIICVSNRRITITMPYSESTRFFTLEKHFLENFCRAHLALYGWVNFWRAHIALYGWSTEPAGEENLHLLFWLPRPPPGRKFFCDILYAYPIRKHQIKSSCTPSWVFIPKKDPFLVILFYFFLLYW